MSRSVPLLLLAALVATACSKTNEAYLPSNDPLVLVRFERLLTNSGIGFNKRPDGMYTPIDPKAFERMVSIGHEALDIEPSRTEILVKSGCALNKLKNYLDGNNIVYALTNSDSEQNLITTKSDFAKFKVLENYAGFKTECAK